MDPAAAQQIDPRNVRRTIRALEVIFGTGRKFSDQRRQETVPHKVISVGLTRPREELYERVDARIEAMFAAGFLDEIQGLLESGFLPHLPSMSAIGYREGIMVVQGKWTIDKAKQEMRRNTRIFIRRQSNWFKESDPHIAWFNPGLPGTIREIAETLRNSLASQVL